jgi:hypothetical protein
MRFCRKNTKQLVKYLDLQVSHLMQGMITIRMARGNHAAFVLHAFSNTFLAADR